MCNRAQDIRAGHAQSAEYVYWAWFVLSARYWRQQLRRSGTAMPNSNTSSELWSAQTKLAIVADTYSMTES